MLSQDQSEALNACVMGHNVLITGQAGTGKSYIIGHLKKRLSEMGKNVSVTASTGIACQQHECFNC